MGLEQYRRKRDFGRTPEPSGKAAKERPGRLYIIQKHAARALHYDLRLELGGVLKSWAVPKGPSLDPGQKRLARHVEDHPLDYGNFEGIIPQGEYGGGTVLLWDRGEWEPEEDPEEGYRKGKLSFRLQGEKLRGSWTLARMGGKGRDGGDWLLIKKNDEEAAPGDDGEFLEKNSRSITSGRSLEEIAADRELVWRNGKAVSSPEQNKELPERPLPGAKSSPLPERISPQLAKLVDQVPTDDEWLHEIKLDGYRLLCFLQQGQARLLTRNQQDWTERFGAVARAMGNLPVSEAVFDGEVVVLNNQGISDFQALQNLLRKGGRGRLVYYLFDLMYLQGMDLTRVPLVERKDLLRRILSGLDPETSVVRYSDHIRGEGERVYEHACRFRLEGIISKRADSSYQQRRAGTWLKIKCQQRQEFVIGGYSPPSGSRTGFGALLVGFYDDRGGLVFAGKVGTGFDALALESLTALLEQRQTGEPPFSNPPKGWQSRGVKWVRPDLVAEIEFSEWTAEGRLRHPSFKGLREDKAPEEIGRERPLGLAQAAKKPPQLAPVERREGKGKMTVAGVPISNPDKVMYPEQGVTKGMLAEYYARAAEWILPYLVGRPLTVVRCPQGRQKKCFYQKHLNESVPPPVRGVAVKEKDGEQLYLVIDDLAGLITLVQLGVLEFHPWGAREDRLERPDMVIFDLDPGPGTTWEEMLHGARRLHQRLSSIDLQSFVKTSGGKGLHVVVPLVRRNSWEEVKAFARAVAEDIAGGEPERFVTTMTKSRRQGKIFIDFFRNSRGATSVAPYSTRARSGAPISTPLRWDELSPDLGPADYTIENLPGRLAELTADPWRGFFKVRQSITKAIHQELRF